MSSSWQGHLGGLGVVLDLPCSEGRTGVKYPSTMVAIFGEPARARRRKSTQFAGVGRIVLIERSSGCFERSTPLRGDSRRRYKSTSVRTASSRSLLGTATATGTGVGTGELEILGEQAALWRCACPRSRDLRSLRPVRPGECIGLGTDRTMLITALGCEGSHTDGRVGDGRVLPCRGHTAGD